MNRPKVAENGHPGALAFGAKASVAVSAHRGTARLKRLEARADIKAGADAADRSRGKALAEFGSARDHFVANALTGMRLLG